MKFEEWVEQSIPMTDREKIFAGFAWMAATKEEREACAKVCEEDAFVDQWIGMAEAARRIRLRSNVCQIL